MRFLRCLRVVMVMVVTSDGWAVEVLDLQRGRAVFRVRFEGTLVGGRIGRHRACHRTVEESSPPWATPSVDDSLKLTP
jgi:hypothetical protein